MGTFGSNSSNGGSDVCLCCNLVEQGSVGCVRNDRGSLCPLMIVCVCVYPFSESLQLLKKQIVEAASELLENWTKLKEVFRIPKKVSVSVSVWDVLGAVMACVHLSGRV